MERTPTISEELKILVDALATAVEMDFMAREHAKLVWRKLLSRSNLDIIQTKGEVNKDDIIKKD